MSQPILQVNELSKCYQLGMISRHTLVEEVEHFFRKFYKSTGSHVASAEKEFWALKNVSFDVHAGEVLGIVGGNGAGKSTLLKILSRITEPTSGTVSIRGRVGSLLEVGTGFHPELTGRENVYMNGTLLGMKKREVTEKFDEIVAFSGVEKFIDTPVKRYSSGMYVRLAFAVAAHLEPEVLIVDEVLAVGDTEFQKKCMGKMDAVAKEGRTVLFVSHNMGVLSQLCTRGILLEKGQVVSQGSISSVIETYLDARNGGNDGAYKRAANAESTEDPHILSVQLLNRDGEPRSEVSVQEPYRFRIRFRDMNKREGLWISLSIKDSFDRRLCTTEKDCSLLSTSDPYEIDIEFPGKNLLPGTYHLMISLTIPKRNLYELLPSAFRFHIADTGNEFSKYEGQDMGVFHVETTMRDVSNV